ncbi:MAG: anthranilate synthase component I family protein [Ferruginibacter sp.]
MLNWLNQFNIFCFLDNQGYDFQEPGFECIAAAGVRQELRAPAGRAFSALQQFCEQNPSAWIFGHLAYDLKNETASLVSRHPDGIGFDDLYFFVPRDLLVLKEGHLQIYTDGDAQALWGAIQAQPATIIRSGRQPVTIRQRISPDHYKKQVEALREHIHRGDCYEINFCQEFYAEEYVMEPLAVFEQLTRLSPNPFSAFYRVEHHYCCCASPERYLKKQGRHIISQPIKGTSRRDHDNPLQDARNRLYLRENAKERSENVMVVDLVRNDLSRVCEPGSVKVDELFGLYSFPQVHQMISTVSGTLSASVHPVEALKATFPMGSMTGAPKIRVMQLIEEYEQTRRGLFSGAIGYFKPGENNVHDFDFNVIIRSLFYNAATQYLSFQAGGGITFYSDPEMEYQESLLKATALLQVLQ